MSETPLATKAPLDEVMLAMDVVDTLRHRERMVERALSADDRDRELVERLKNIYAGQGIEVSDAIIERGVSDLRQDRFIYIPTPPSIGRSLARVYVSRGRWGPPLAIAIGLVAAALLAYQTLVRGPALEAIAALPDELTAAHTAVTAIAEVPEATRQADSLFADGRAALDGEDYDSARAVIDELAELEVRLDARYAMRVVSRPGDLSGVWRIPEENPEAQNYYLIVEAIDPDGNRLRLPILNEENGRTSRVARWGQRVEQQKFESVADDKRDDGIIQNATIGEKRRGFFEPDLDDGVLAGAITDW